MRKLLIMASLFYPQKKGGGPTISLMNLVQAIQDEFDIHIISHNYEVGSNEPLEGIQNGWNTFPFGKVYYFPHGQNSMKNIYSLIEEIQPEVIYQNSFFSYDEVLPVLQYKKKHKDVGIVIAPRGEICENRFSDGKLKKTVYVTVLRTLGMLKDVYFQATGVDEFKDMEKYLKIPRERMYDINNFSYANKEYILPIEKKPGELKLCYIARIQDTKNLLYAVQRLAKAKGNITYDIYGSLENQSYYDKCFSVPLPNNIKLRYCGLLDHDDVGKTLSNYHAYYMPTIGENYGHSIVESMLHHRPVVISDKTPWNGINQADAGYAIPLADEKRFENVLEELCSMDQEQYQVLCEKAGRFIENELHIDEIVKKYIKCFNEV